MKKNKFYVYGLICCLLFSLFSSSLFAMEIGDTLPVISASNQRDEQVKLKNYAKEKYLLVFFFPKADTPGCTDQACSLRDEYAKLNDKGVSILGVSNDSPQELLKFQKKYRLPFDLISDKKKAFVKAFDVSTTFGFASRQAFLFKEGKLVWMDRKASTKRQAQDVLKFLKD